MKIIADTLDRYARTIVTPFTEDRSQTVGASEVGQCARKIFWIKNEAWPEHGGVARDPEHIETWGARMRGTMFETHFWVPAMQKRFGRRLKFVGKKQRTLVKNFLSATPDALVTPLSSTEAAAIGAPGARAALFECKTADPRTNLVEAKNENVFQTHVQMGLMQETTRYKPTHAVISYTDASFWSDVKEFTIAFDESIYEAAQERASLIMTTRSAGDLAAEGWIAGGHECRYCPFTRPCGIERRNLPYADDIEADPQFAQEMTDMAREYKLLERNRDTAEVELRTAQDAIKARLREKGVRRIPGVLTWSSVKGRSGFDNKAIQQAATLAGVDITQFATQGDPTDRLVIQITV